MPALPSPMSHPFGAASELAFVIMLERTRPNTLARRLRFLRGADVVLSDGHGRASTSTALDRSDLPAAAFEEDAGIARDAVAAAVPSIAIGTFARRATAIVLGVGHPLATEVARLDRRRLAVRAAIELRRVVAAAVLSTIETVAERASDRCGTL